MIEKELIQALKEGSQPAFTQLVESYQTQILNVCLGMVPNLHDAEDIVQDVFIEVHRSIGEFRNDAKLSTWLYRIAVSKSLSFIRHKKRKKRLFFFQSLIGLDNKEVADQTSDWNHPGVGEDKEERTKLLFAQVEQLPTKQRVAFVLNKIDGLSYKETADVMETSVASVESLLFRAKKNLQKSLKEHYKK